MNFIWSARIHGWMDGQIHARKPASTKLSC